MISASVIVSMLFSMQVMAGTERDRFSRCLRAFVDTKIEERLTAEAFDTAVVGACAQQEAAYRSAYVAAAVRAGDGRMMAERDAGLEVEDLRANYKELFRGSLPAS